MIVVTLTPTSRRAGRGHEWTRGATESRTYPDLATARQALAAEFGRHTRPCYLERTGAPDIQNGRIYCYTEVEQGRTYYMQVWASFFTQGPRQPIDLSR